MSAPDERLTAALFDLGGVLIDWNPRHLYRKIFEDPVRMEEFLARVCTPEWNEEQDAGRGWAEAVAQLVAEHPHFEREIRAYRERWDEMLRGEIAESVAVLGELRDSGLPLYALTNWSAETFPIAVQRFPFLAWFAGILVSGHEGVRKPDRAIFQLATDRFGLDPRTTLFIDDVERNIRAARAFGFRVHHFTGAEGLRRCLSEVGALPG